MFSECWNAIELLVSMLLSKNLPRLVLQHQLYSILSRSDVTQIDADVRRLIELNYIVAFKAVNSRNEVLLMRSMDYMDMVAKCLQNDAALVGRFKQVTEGRKGRLFMALTDLMQMLSEKDIECVISLYHC